MSSRNRNKKQRELNRRLHGRRRDQPKETDIYMLVRKGMVQRTFTMVDGIQKKIWPIAESMADARKLAAFLKCGSDVVPARIGSIPGETMQGHVNLAIQERCQLIVIVVGWSADGTPRWKTMNLEKSWLWSESQLDPENEVESDLCFEPPIDYVPGLDSDLPSEPLSNLNHVPSIPVDALFDEDLGPNLSASVDPRQRLRLAELIIAVDTMTGEIMPVYGVKVLEEIVATGMTRNVPMLKVELDKDTDDLEKLIALIRVIKGESD